MRLPKWIFAVWMLGLASGAMGEVQRIEIEASTDVLGGAAFCDVGGYRKITGRVYFVFDPGNAANSRIVDLDRAPRNAQGMVEAWGDFMVPHPKDPAEGERDCARGSERPRRQGGARVLQCGAIPVRSRDRGEFWGRAADAPRADHHRGRLAVRRAKAVGEVAPARPDREGR